LKTSPGGISPDFMVEPEAQIDASRRALTNYGKVEENCNATGDVMAALG
jgi:hypothetical protein